MPAGESMRQEARRRGVSFAKVKGERLYREKGISYRTEREERQRRQSVRDQRAMGAPLPRSPLPDVAEDVAEAPWEPGYGEAKGMQGPFSPSPSPDWDYYWPTRTINPPRPRTLQARYSQSERRLEVIFRDGTPWHYDQVPPGIWTRFKRVRSPGQYINAVLNGYPYGHGGWGSIVGE